MLIHFPNPITSDQSLLISKTIKTRKITTLNKKYISCSNSCIGLALIVTSLFAAWTVVTSASAGAAVDAASQLQQQDDTLSNIPQTLSGECASKECKTPRIQRPKSRKAESCTIKCVTTCIRGGEGSPGEGPFNIQRPLVVFKQGFRSRRYCLVECSDICNLIGDGDDGT